jgi:hypothetical protein
MSAYQPHANGPHARIRAREAKEFRLIFLVTFPIFLAAGLVTRALSPRRSNIQHKSVFAEARAAANTCIPFAFMR